MASTGQRFDRYAPREPAVFGRFLENFDAKAGLEGIKEVLGNFEHHPDGIESYDIRCKTERGHVTFDIQESQDFGKYGDVRIDYVSAFRPVEYRTQSLAQFERDLAAHRVSVDVWGKVVNPKADFLVYEFRNGRTWWQIYDLRALHELLPKLKHTGRFRTNRKRGESWGSAFLAVPERHAILQGAKPATLEDVLGRARSQR